MRFGHLLRTALYLVCCTVLFLGQDKQSSTEPKAEHHSANSGENQPKQQDLRTNHGPVDILSDTGGVDVHPYLDRVLPMLKAHWYQKIPESAELKKGKVTISFRIMKDGKITDVVYLDRSGDSTLDQAAFDGISGSSPLPSLPSDFLCKYLGLSIHFYYNLDSPPSEDSKGSLIPCVTTKISSVQPVAIEVSPVSAEVITGARQQFFVRVTGDESAEVMWTVRGSGCSGSSCGSISPQGLYVAPSSTPSPPKVTVTATFVSDPAQTATATVTVVQPPKPR